MALINSSPFYTTPEDIQGGELGHYGRGPCFKPVKTKPKNITILYDNGKTYTTTCLETYVPSPYGVNRNVLKYTRDKTLKGDNGIVSEVTERITVPLSDVAAVVVEDRETNTYKVFKYKPCAKVHITLSKT